MTWGAIPAQPRGRVCSDWLMRRLQIELGATLIGLWPCELLSVNSTFNVTNLPAKVGSALTPTGPGAFDCVKSAERLAIYTGTSTGKALRVAALSAPVQAVFAVHEMVTLPIAAGFFPTVAKAAVLSAGELLVCKDSSSSWYTLAAGYNHSKNGVPDETLNGPKRVTLGQYNTSGAAAGLQVGGYAFGYTTWDFLANIYTIAAMSAKPSAGATANCVKIFGEYHNLRL